MMTKLAWGVDGCAGGWLAVGLADDDRWQAALYPDAASLWDALASSAPVLIDMPIGLPDDGPRAVDQQARAMLGPRRSSVFPVPVRDAFDAPDYAAACQVNQQATGKRFSRQTWNIMPRIRELDALLRADRSARDSLLEAHPEVAFHALNGTPMPYSKKHPLGFLDRLRTLQGYLPAAEAAVRAIYADYSRQAVVDDVVDALVLAVSTRIGAFRTIPETLDYDRCGLPMQVVYPRVAAI